MLAPSTSFQNLHTLTINLSKVSTSTAPPSSYMAPPVDVDEALKYIMLILKHTEMPKPNYPAVAEEAGINTPANAQVITIPELLDWLANSHSQRRFKSLIEKAGYLLVNDQVVAADGTIVTPKKPRVKKGENGTAPLSKKKRKVQEATMDDAGENGSGVKDEILEEVANNGGERSGLTSD